MSSGVIDRFDSLGICSFTWYPQCVQAADLMFSPAAALLFQSTERLLIDVGSVRVATNGMEEILKLLTERDIEHTNNLPLHSSYLHSPFPRSTPPCRACVNISLSLGLAQPTSTICPYRNLCCIWKIIPYIQKPTVFLPGYKKLTY